MQIRAASLAALSLFSSCTVSNAELLSCQNVPLTVDAPSAALAMHTCQAAERALPRLAECGVALHEPQNIKIADSIPKLPECFGLYHCGENRIELVSPDTLEHLRREDSAFHAIPTLAFFDSILVHELAHAAYDNVPCPYPSCSLTSEYVAYAMQVRTLPPAERNLFEAGASMETRVSRYEISMIGLHMAPDQFARNVWAHFSQRDDGCAYVADMMKANFYLDTERP